MSETFDTTTLEEAPPRRLVRVHDGRWLGGVAAGLGRYFDVNPLIYRIAFAALAFAGGTGLLLYLAAWLVIPGEDREESIAVEALRLHRDRPWLVLGVGLLFFGALLALSEARLWPGPGNVWLAAILGGAALVWWHVSGTRDRTPQRDRSPHARRRRKLEKRRPRSQLARPRRREAVAVRAGVGVLLAAAGLFGLLDGRSASTTWTSRSHSGWQSSVVGARSLPGRYRSPRRRARRARPRPARLLRRRSGSPDLAGRGDRRSRRASRSTRTRSSGHTSSAWATSG